MPLPVFVLSCSDGPVRDSVMSQLVRGAGAARVAAIVPGRRRKQHPDRTRDGITLIPTRERLARLGEGCACCTVRGDLLPKVHNIADQGLADQVLIHLPPQSDLGVLAKTFTVPDSRGALLGDKARFQALIAAATVDELHRASRGSGSRQLVERLELAQVILLAGGGSSSPPTDEAERLVRALNPAARVMSLDSEQVSLEEFSGGGPFDLITARRRAGLEDLLDVGGASAGEGGGRAVFRARRPFHPARFHAWLASPLAGLVRARGTFWVASRPHLAASLDVALGDCRTEVIGHWWAAVPEQQRPTSPAFKAYLREMWDPVFGDRRQELAFVGVDLDEARLITALRSCLLTDGELAQPERWSSGAHPFRWGREDA